MSTLSTLLQAMPFVPSFFTLVEGVQHAASMEGCWECALDLGLKSQHVSATTCEPTPIPNVSERFWERIPHRLPPKSSAAFGAPKYEAGVGRPDRHDAVGSPEKTTFGLIHFRFHWLCQRNVIPSICETQQHSTYVEGAWPPPYGCNPTKGMLKFLTDIYSVPLDPRNSDHNRV